MLVDNVGSCTLSLCTQCDGKMKRKAKLKENDRSVLYTIRTIQTFDEYILGIVVELKIMPPKPTIRFRKRKKKRSVRIK